MQNYLINSRSFTLVDELSRELIFDPHKNYLFDLSYLGILDFTGEKAIEFLQGQVTSDLKKLKDQEMLPGAICNLKGRILTLFQTCNLCGLKMILPVDLLEDTQKALLPAAMLSRVKIKQNNDYKILGFYFQDATDLSLPEALPAFNFYTPGMNPASTSGRFLLLFVGEEERTALVNTFIKTNQYKGSLAWHTLTLLNNAFDIYPETRGEFLPHHLGLHHTSYIDFAKGCYKGQEIIARMQYRAVIKHEFDLFTIQFNNPIFSGQKIMSESNSKDRGQLIDFSPITENQMLVAATVLIDKAN